MRRYSLCLLVLLEACGVGHDLSPNNDAAGDRPGDATPGFTVVPPAVSPNDRPTPQPTPTPTPTAGPSTIGPNDRTWLRFVGRVDTATVANTARMAYAGSGVVARFVGTELTLLFAEEGDFPAPRRDYLNVTIDGDTRRVMLDPAVGSYAVATGLPPGEHLVVVSKRTDPSVRVAAFLGMRTSADGNFLAPPAAKARRIEVVGPSQVSGYGMNGRDGTSECVDAAFYQAFNADTSYIALAARDLDAEWVNLGMAGKGITRNYAVDDSTRTLPFIYPRSIPNDPNALFDFATSPTDVVVMAGGGADFTIGPPNPTPEQFIAAYTAFVRDVRAHNPAALIIVGVDAIYRGDFRNQLHGYFAEIVARVNDPQVMQADFPAYEPSDGFGCGEHPNVAGSRKLADALVNTVRTRLGWR